MAATTLTTASGCNIDLLKPDPADIDFDDIAEHLAKVNRYNGATPRRAYSVAQHLCVGADAVLAETGSETAAAYFLAHDFEEYALGDDTTPKKRALEAIAVERFGTLSGAITGAFAELRERWEIAIHAAAGLAWPRPPEIEALVHRYDRIMLLTEWRDFMDVAPPFDSESLAPLPGVRLLPWWWEVAETNLLSRMRRWLPALRDRP